MHSQPKVVNAYSRLLPSAGFYGTCPPTFLGTIYYILLMLIQKCDSICSFYSITKFHKFNDTLEIKIHFHFI